MRQLSIGETLGRPEPGVSMPVDGALPVYDFFCGGGGFSTGAEIAGCQVVFACDADEDALQMHRENHPHTKHACLTLPRDEAQIPWPTEGTPFHAHFSPPCQSFSKCKTRCGGKKRKAEAVEDAQDLMRWSLDAALRCGATSWSLEEVWMPKVVEVLEEYRERHHKRMSYAVVEMSELGVPQTRTRVLAGTPALIAAMLRRRGEVSPPSVRDVIEVRGTHIHTGVNVKRCDPESWNRHLHHVSGLGPTVLAGGGLWWINHTPSGTPVRAILTPREAATIQTFPASTKLPRDKKLARRLVGNAVPPQAAAVLMRRASPPLA